MRFLIRSAVLPIFLCLILAGCGGNSSQDSSKNESPKPQPAPAQQAASPSPAAEPASGKAPEAKSTAPSQPAPRPSAAQPHAPPAPAEQKSNIAPAVPAEVRPEVQKPAAVSAEPPKIPAVPQEAPAKTAAASAPKVLPKDVLILKGSPMGGVKFEHKLHSQVRNIQCDTCHHASKPEKPASAPQQACSACHTTLAVPPMKTKLQAAFHSPTATSGTCIDCHKTQNASGKAAPVKCLDCHKKSNT
jgi:hypothetical protein